MKYAYVCDRMVYINCYSVRDQSNLLYIRANRLFNNFIFLLLYRTFLMKYQFYFLDKKLKKKKYKIRDLAKMQCVHREI